MPAWAGKPKHRAPFGRSAQGHPRVGGETGQQYGQGPNAVGPSPRGRGNRRRVATHACSAGAIPAWAGKPPCGWMSRGGLWGHPRVGGETAGPTCRAPYWPGPSPRGRGNQSAVSKVPLVKGAIPAWAGKPRHANRQGRHHGGHPRVGGETEAHGQGWRHFLGPSPRGRGNRAGHRRIFTGNRAIPAWAGKPPSGARVHGADPGHPRVGGETYRVAVVGLWVGGPSPRGRGNPLSPPTVTVESGAIPAWAGKPASWAASECGDRGHPRVGGETISPVKMGGGVSGPSPRGRGNRHAWAVLMRRHRAIPAWAGKPHGPIFQTRGIRGHPRVGGETHLLRFRMT